MKLISSIYKNVALSACLALGLGACSDGYMSDLNQDPTKAETVNPGYQLTFALLSTYGNFTSMETARAYVAPYTQMYAGAWNAANYGGANAIKDDLLSAWWTQHYKFGIKNLVDAEYNSQNDPVLNAAIRVHKVYLFDLLTDVYGDIPVKEAGKAYYDGIVTPRYDTQEEIYDYFFRELDDCIAVLSSATASQTLKAADVTSMGGDVRLWARYANALKMRLAMRISDVKPELAARKFKEADSGVGPLAPDENAYVVYMHVPYSFETSTDDVDFRVNAFSEILYGQDSNQPMGFGMTLYDLLGKENDPRQHVYCRFISENFRDNNDPSIGREDFTKEVLAAENDGDPTTLGVQMMPPCWAWYDSGNTEAGNYPWPKPDCITGSDHYKTFVAGREDQVIANAYVKAVRGAIATEFISPETPGMLVSGAEVCLLKAEAAVKGWITDDADALYKKGIEMAMSSVVNKVYGTAFPISQDDIIAYQAAHTLAADAELAKEQINTQAYFLHFGNPFEAWANLRRSDYPALYGRAQFGANSCGWNDPDGGMELNQPARLYYPQEEMNYNNENYQAAVARMKDGKFSWHTRMWWDVKEQNYTNKQ